MVFSVDENQAAEVEGWAGGAKAPPLALDFEMRAELQSNYSNITVTYLNRAVNNHIISLLLYLSSSVQLFFAKGK